VEVTTPSTSQRIDGCTTIPAISVPAFPLAERAKPARLALDHILLDDRLQSRKLKPGVVEEYLGALRRGGDLPPVRVVRDVDDHYYLVDGHHRIAAIRQMLGVEDITVEIVHGTFADALWLSWGANRGHRLRRTQKDKHRTIQAAINHPRWSLESDRAIARHIGCDHKTVASMRREPVSGEFPTHWLSLSGPSKSKILRACQLLSRVQPEQARQFDRADIAKVRAGYEPLHRLLFGFSTLQLESRGAKKTDRRQK
jgi:hypothetical protein